MEQIFSGFTENSFIQLVDGKDLTLISDSTGINIVANSYVTVSPYIDYYSKVYGILHHTIATLPLSNSLYNYQVNIKTTTGDKIPFFKVTYTNEYLSPEIYYNRLKDISMFRLNNHIFTLFVYENFISLPKNFDLEMSSNVNVTVVNFQNFIHKKLNTNNFLLKLPKLSSLGKEVLGSLPQK